jgi:putative DNA primase/helicase
MQQPLPSFAESGGIMADERAFIRDTEPKKKKAYGKAAPFVMQRTEVDMAALLVERFGDELRFCAALGGWHVWTGAHWALDVSGHARECAKALARELASQATETLDVDVFKEAKRAGSAAGVRAILELAQSTPGIVFTPEAANRDPWALNVGNGTINLQTGELRPHDRQDLNTRCCPVDFDPEAEAPMFETFLREIQPNPQVCGYLARLFGYAASGVVRDHVLGVLWGPGANGKSVLADVVTHALGDYAKPGPSSLIVSDGKHTPHPTDVASCAGSRMVVLHETKRGASFDASKVKLLTGGDRLTARHMRQDFFDFKPTHTLIMLSNYKPQADATDAALWRRIQLVPFNVVIPPERQDRELADKIRSAELPGVLRWTVLGALQWQQRGLDPPSIVQEQTEAYRAAEDVIGAFIEERCTRNKVAKVKAGTLYASFKEWCQSQGAHVVRGNDFSAELQARGFRRKKTNTGAIYFGLGLNPDDTEGGWHE